MGDVNKSNFTDPLTGLPLIYTFNDADMKNDQGLNSNDPFTPYTGTVDSRLDWTVDRRGIPLFDWGLFGSNSNWLYDQSIGGPYGLKKHSFVKQQRVLMNHMEAGHS